MARNYICKTRIREWREKRKMTPAQLCARSMEIKGRYFLNLSNLALYERTEEDSTISMSALDLISRSLDVPMPDLYKCIPRK